MNNKVIVLGADHYNAIGVVQSLGLAGMYVILVLVGQKNSLISHSNYVGELHIVHSYQDGIDYIVSHLVQEQKTVIIPCGDEAALLLDKNKMRLVDSFLFQHSTSQYSMEELMNKNTQMKLASESGLDVPKSWEINSLSDIPSDVSLPVIIKPLLSCEGDKHDISVIRDSNLLVNEVKSLLFHTPRLVLQEFIESKDEELNIIGCRLTDGTCTMPVIIKKERVHPLGRGSVSVGSVYPVGADKKYLIDFIEKLMANMGYVGLYSVELMISNKGEKAYFIEANLRNDALNTFILKSGVNLPLAHVLDLQGEQEKQRIIITKPKKYICEPMHSASVYHRGISIWTWIKDILTCDGFMLGVKGDRKMFYRQYIRRFINIR